MQWEYLLIINHDHDILLKKMDRYGIRGMAFDWLKRYMGNRQQFVQLGQSKSGCLDITCGVPQGSVLGPKLFVLYINDICKVSNVLKFVVFADDTNIYLFWGGLEAAFGCGNKRNR